MIIQAASSSQLVMDIRISPEKHAGNHVLVFMMNVNKHSSFYRLLIEYFAGIVSSVSV